MAERVIAQLVIPKPSELNRPLIEQLVTWLQGLSESIPVDQPNMADPWKARYYVNDE